MITLAGQVVIQSARERVFHVILAHLLALLVLTPWVAELALGAPTRAVRDLGLTAVWASACPVAIWVGIRHVGGELRARTAALVLVRMSRGRWVAGRLLGVGTVLALEVVGLVSAFALAAGISRLPTGLGWFLALTWAECCVLASLSALLGAVVEPGFAAVCAAGLWFAGHLSDEYAQVAGAWLPRLVYAVVPDLDLFVVQTELVHDLPISGPRGWIALGYGAAWTGVFTLATALAVARRDAG